MAEAFVLVRPDTRSFAAELQRQVTQAIGSLPTPTVKVNTQVVAGRVEGAQAAARSAVSAAAASRTEVAAVQAVTDAQQKAGFAALTAAQSRVKAAQTVAAVEQAASEKAVNALTAEAAARKSAERTFRDSLAVREASVRAAQKFDAIEKAGLTAQSEVAKIRAKLVAAVRADEVAQNSVSVANARGTATAQELAAAVKAQTASVVQATQAELDLAIATSTATKAASAQAATSAARFSQAGRGATAAAAGFAGLRGAVLASTGPFLAATVAVTALGKALSAGANLEQQLNVFQATTGATADQMNRVSEAARTLGNDITLPGVAAGDAAATMTELAKAGLSVEDSIAGARGVLQLATAANIDFAAASELAASALNSFGLAGDQAGRVADVFAGAANAAQGSIQDFALANQQVDAVARQVGLSLEDTTAILAELAKNGLRGSDAGTSLRTALIRLISPTQEARTLLDQLGVSIRDAQGNVDPLVFAKFGEAVAGLAPDLRDSITATIFGQDAIRAVAIAAREGEDGFNRMSAAVSQSGTAQKLAEARSKGLKGAVEAAKSQLETFGETISGPVLGALASFVRGAGQFVESMSEIIGVVIKFGTEVKDVIDKIPGLKKALDLSNEARSFLNPLKNAQRLLDAFTTSASESAAAAAKLAATLQANKEAFNVFSGTGQLETAGAAQTQALEDRNKKILELIGNLNSGLETFANSGEIDQGTIDSLLNTVDQLKNLGGDAVQEALRQNGSDIANILGEQFRGLADAFGVPLDALQTKIPQTLKNVINRLGQTDAGKRVLRKFGEQIAQSLADGIDEGSVKAAEAARKAVEQAAKAVQDAQRNVADTIKNAGEQFIQSIVSARATSRSLADSLGSQFDKLFDVSPQVDKLKKELDKADDALEAFRRKRTTSALDSSLTDAQAELTRQQSQIKTFGKGLSAEAQSKLNELLKPARDAVTEANNNIIENRLQNTTTDRQAFLEGRIKSVEDLNTKAKEAAQQGLSDLVEKLNDGRINAQQFGAALTKQLADPLNRLRSKAGKNLGLRFTNDFLTQMQTLAAEAKVLAPFAGVDTGVQGVVNPADVRAQGNQDIKKSQGQLGDAQTALADAKTRLNEALGAQTKTAANTDSMVLLLQSINSKLGPNQIKVPTQTTGGATKNRNKQTNGGATTGVIKR